MIAPGGQSGLDHGMMYALCALAVVGKDYDPPVGERAQQVDECLQLVARR